MSTIYKITLLEWFKHNPNAKKSYKKTMIENKLINDAKVNALPLSHKWLFINLILICGDHGNDTITLTQRQVNDILTTKEGASNALDRMKSFQLLTYEKIALNELKEEKRIERKERKERKEVPEGSKTPPSDQQNLIDDFPKKNQQKILNQKIWDSYKNAYFLRYKVEPMRNATVNAQISNLGKRLGEEAIKVIAFYVSSNNSFYLQKLHQVGPCLADAESLRTQWARGKAITQNDVRNFEKINKHNELLKSIEEEGI